MDRDAILALARQAGIDVHDRKQQARIGMDTLTGEDSTQKLALFAALAVEDFLARTGQYVTNDASRSAAIAEAVAAEREACAQVLDAMAAEAEANIEPSCVVAYYRERAAIIRARGHKDGA